MSEKITLRRVTQIVADTIGLLAVAGWCILLYNLCVLLITVGGTVGVLAGITLLLTGLASVLYLFLNGPRS